MSNTDSGSKISGRILSRMQNQEILPRNSGSREHRVLSRRFLRSLFFATQVVDNVADEMYNDDQYQWQRTVLGHTFSISRSACLDHGEGTTSMINAARSWLRAHEEAQVMLASILVVVGLWWLVRAVLALLINLVCPVLVVLLAVVLVPQLRTPLLGQNYAALAGVLRSILLKMAENIKIEN